MALSIQSKLKSSIFAICLLVLGTLAYKKYEEKVSAVASLTVHPGSIYSFDPFTYDVSGHHFIQRPVLGTLVSNYKRGEIIGVVASGWQVLDDGRRWTFKIRDGLKTENGDSVNAEMVVSSLRRMCFLMKKKGSRSGVFEFLRGYESFETLDDELEGLTVDSARQTVTFQFGEAPASLLDKLAFGLYGVAHPADYDEETGDWRDPKKVTSTGPYRAEAWGDEELHMVLRDDFPFKTVFGHDRPFQRLTFLYGSSGNQTNGELYFGFKSEAPRSQLSFRGEAKNSIYFLRVLGAENEESPLFQKEFRVAARTRFYETALKNGIEITRSFLPLSIKGVSQFDDPKRNDDQHVLSRSLRLYVSGSQSAYKASLSAAFRAALAELGTTVLDESNHTFGEIVPFLDPHAVHAPVDVLWLATGVLLSHPFDDLRFMVESSEGIRLPDPTGRLRKLVSSNVFDPQRYNEIVWDDALVWPVTHPTRGLWYDSDKVDLSLLDLTQAPTEMALVMRAP